MQIPTALIDIEPLVKDLCDKYFKLPHFIRRLWSHYLLQTTSYKSFLQTITMTTIQQDGTMPSSMSTAPDGGDENIVLQGIINDQQRHHKQISDLLNHNRAEIDTLKHNCMTNYKQITKLEALVAEKESELDAVRSDYKDFRDTSQQEYAELQATSQQLIDKLQKEIVNVTAQKKKYKERLDKFISFTQSFTPGKPEAKALAETSGDDAEEQPVGVIAASSVASPHAAVHTPNPVAVLDTSLQNKHFNNSGDEVEEVAEDDPSAPKKSEEVAENEDGEEDTSSPPASTSKKSEEDVLQDDSDMTAAPKNSDDEGEELDENEPGAKEEEDDDGKNDDKLLTIAENEQLPADAPIDSSKTSPPQSEDEDEYETALSCDEDDPSPAPPDTRDAGSQTPPPSRKTRSSSSSVKRVAKSPNLVFAKKPRKYGRRTQ